MAGVPSLIAGIFYFISLHSLCGTYRWIMDCSFLLTPLRCCMHCIAMGFGKFHFSLPKFVRLDSGIPCTKYAPNLKGETYGKKDRRSVVVLLPTLREEAAPTPGRGHMSGSNGPLPGTPLRMGRGDHRRAGKGPLSQHRELYHDRY